MENYWVSGVNNHGTFGRWDFAEFTDVYEMEEDFAEKVAWVFDRMLRKVGGKFIDKLT